jgi:hypothetical protein
MARFSTQLSKDACVIAHRQPPPGRQDRGRSATRRRRVSGVTRISGAATCWDCWRDTAPTTSPPHCRPTSARNRPELWPAQQACNRSTVRIQAVNATPVRGGAGCGTSWRSTGNSTFSDADERPSNTSRPASLRKIRQSRRSTTLAAMHCPSPAVAAGRTRWPTFGTPQVSPAPNTHLACRRRADRKITIADLFKRWNVGLG